MSSAVAKRKPVKKEKSLKVEVLDIKGEVMGSYDLDSFVFDGKVNQTLMHQAVITYLANQRKGLASTKTRGNVRGGGRKPWRQKGTGRARVGSIRSPIWRGGGVTFGPLPHSFRKQLPKKMKTMAFKSALNAKFNDDQIKLLDELRVAAPKTKDFSKILSTLKLGKKKIRFVVDEIDVNCSRAIRNIPKVNIIRASDIGAKDVLDCKELILTKSALQKIEDRIKKCLQ